MTPMWKMMQNVNIGEPTSFLDHAYLGCNQLDCKPNETIIEHYTMMFESRISFGAKENWARANCGVILRHGGTRSKCVERYCEQAYKKVEQLHKVSSPCLDDHQFRQEEHESVGELSEVCSQIALKCWDLERIGRPDILCSVNKLSRAVTRWTRACDKR